MLEPILATIIASKIFKKIHSEVIQVENAVRGFGGKVLKVGDTIHIKAIVSEVDLAAGTAEVYLTSVAGNGQFASIPLLISSAETLAKDFELFADSAATASAVPPPTIAPKPGA